MSHPWQQFLSRPDADSFAPFYEATKDVVWTICVRVLGDEEAAADAFQGVWNRLLQDALKSPHTLSSDMATVVRAMAWREAERVRGARRRLRRRESAVEDLGELDAADGSNPREAASAGEMREKLELLVALLPDLYRVPVQLHYFHGMTYAEIAATTGRSVSTISTQISRGVARLQALAKRAGLRDATAALAACAGTASMLAPPAGASAAAAFFVASAALTTASPTSLILGVTVMKMKGTIAAMLIVFLLITAGIFYLGNGADINGTGSRVASLPVQETAGDNDDELTEEASLDVVDAEVEEDASSLDTVQDSQPVDVAAGGQVTEPMLDHMIQTSIFGTVYTKDGSPAAEATVWLPLTEYSVLTDDEGKFELKFPKTSLVQHLSRRPTGLAAVKDGLRSSVRSITLKIGDRNGPHNLTLAEEGRLLTVLVIDKENGEPVPAAIVQLQDGRQQTADELGAVHFEALKAGEWQVEAWGDGYTRTRKTASLLLQEDALIEVALSPGASAHGVVRDEAGVPLSGVEYMRAMSGPMAFVRPAYTGFDGRYRVENLPLDGADVSFEKEGYPNGSTGTLRFEKGGEEKEVDVVLKRGDSISGHVADAKTGAPIAEAKITYSPNGGGQATTLTDASGSFTLGALQRFPEADLLVEGKGYHPVLIPRMWDNPQQSFDFQLQPGFWIRGRVEDQNGKPVAGVWISPLLNYKRYVYLRGGSSGDRPFETTEDGTFYIDSLSSDARFDIVPTRSGHADQRQVQLPLNANDVVVKLGGYGTAKGIVLSTETRKPVTRFNVRLEGSYEVSRVRRGTDFDSPDGRFMLGELHPGTHASIIVSAEGYLSGSVDIPLDGKEEEIFLEPKEIGTLKGSVVDAAGNPVGGARIILVEGPARGPRDFVLWSDLLRGFGRSGESSARFFTSDADGRFTVTDIPRNGLCDLLVYVPGYGRRRFLEVEKLETEMKVILRPASSIRITVDRASLPAAENVELRKSNLRGDTSEFMGYNKLTDGGVVYSDLGEGQYEVRLWGGGAPDPLVNMEVTLGGGEVRDVHLPERSSGE